MGGQVSAADITLLELQTEFAARGFNYLSTLRQNYYLNQGYLVDICEAEDWPFLETTTTGSAPLSITDLRTIASVVDTTQAMKLTPLDNRNITDDIDSSLTTVGTPVYYYKSGQTTIAVYPTNTTDSLSVRYWKVPPELSGATDTPVLPNRWRLLIVDAAVARAYEDADETAAYQAATQSFQARLDQMRQSLTVGQHDEPDDYILAVDSEFAPFVTWTAP